MSLERRIADALHAADSYQPSLDLFSRLNRSIEEDAAHRRRVRSTVISTVVGLLLLTLFLGAVSSRADSGTIMIPKWSLQAAVTGVLVAVLMSLGPILRRLGGPLFDEVFHLNPATGERFSRLLDIGYYLFFGGIIVSGIDPTTPLALVDAVSIETYRSLTDVAGFLLQLGVVHVANLALLPLIGLLFTALMRRAKRRAAGDNAPLLAAGAHQADRIATAIVMTAAAVGVIGVLSLIAVVMVGFTMA